MSSHPFSGVTFDDVIRFDKRTCNAVMDHGATPQQKHLKDWEFKGFNPPTFAKVLGILAALIMLRFIIQAIGRGVGVEEDIEVLGEISGDIEDEEFERPETPHDIILSRVQQMVRERPEDAAKLIRTMLVEEGSGS